MDLDEALVVWTAALGAGFAQAEDWVAWADREIMRLDVPPMWVLDLAIVHTFPEAQAVLGKAFSAIAPVVWQRLNYADLWLGFLYLRFERGDVALLQLLLDAGRLADCSIASIECEAFYVLANEIDGGGPTFPSEIPLPDRARTLFSSLAQAAREWWGRLRAGQ